MAWLKNNTSQESGAMENGTVYCDTCLHSFNNIYAGLLTTYVLVVGPANSRMLWLMMSSSNFLTEKMDLCQFSLLVNDLVLGLVISAVVPGLYLFHRVAQYLWGFSNGFLMVGRPIFQSAICLERYLAVLHPHAFLRYRPLRYRVAILALGCVVVAACCCFKIVFCATTTHSLVFTRVYVSQLLLFLAFNSFCCLSILWALYHPSVGEVGLGQNPGKKKAFNTIVAIEISMLCCYTPQISGFVMTNSMEEQIYCRLYTSGVINILISSCLYSLHNLWPHIQACVSRVRGA